METTTTTEPTEPAIIVEQDGEGYTLYAESAFVECVYLQPIKGMVDNFLVLFALKDGSQYAYFSKEFTRSNLFSSLFAQPVLSLGKWLNLYVKPISTVYRVNEKDASLGLRVSDRFPREAVSV
jgi:hypothetical protein